MVAGDLSLLLLCGALAIPGLLGAARGYGLGAVAVAGDVPRPVLWWVAVVVASAAVLLVAGPRPVLVACVACVGTALLTAPALAAVGRVGLDSYYPNKTLWTAVALGLPLVGAAATRLLFRADACVRLGRPLVVVTGSLAGCLALLSAATPIVGVAGSWSGADGRVVMDTVTAGRAPSATVVWGVGTETDAATSQLLLDFYSATSTSAPLGLVPREVDAQCAVLVAAASPVVLSRTPVEEVRQRFACVQDVEVVSP